MLDQADIHQALVAWVADNAPDGWRRVEINMEVLSDTAEASSSWVIRCYAGDHPTKVDFAAPGRRKLEMRDLFLELNDLSDQMSQH